MGRIVGDLVLGSGNPDGKSLNRLADRGDIENITRKWNGGLNGYADRLTYYDRLALAFLSYGINDMLKLQKIAKLEDTSGRSGPLTRAALHSALLRLTAPQRLSAHVATAPVVGEVAVEVKVPVLVDKPVAVTPPGLNAPWWQSKEILGPAVGGRAATALTAVGSIPWQNLALVLVVFVGVSLFLYWRKRTYAKAVRVMAAEVEQ